MADAIKLGSGVPKVPLRRADDLIERISALKADAEARGFGTLAYFLETALIEARLQEQHIIDDTAIAWSKPDDLWHPVEDLD